MSQSDTAGTGEGAARADGAGAVRETPAPALVCVTDSGVSARAAAPPATGAESTAQDVHEASIQAEVQALLRMLALGRGSFVLAFAVCNEDRLRDLALAGIRAQSPGILQVVLPPGIDDVLGCVERAIPTPPASPPDGVCVLGFDSVITGEFPDAAIGALNASRDLWPARVPVPVVFWVSEFTMGRIEALAPDFWRFRRHTFHFARSVVPGFGPDEWIPATSAAYDDLDARGKLDRIAELERRIAAARGDPALAGRMFEWWIELVRIRGRMGAADRAEHDVREAIALAEATGDARARGLVLVELADLLVRRGDPDAALRLLEDDVLPAVTAAGDVRAQVVIRGKIAHALAATGRFDDALRLLRDELLPAFELAQDERLRAVALGKIADLEFARGNVDEALRIRTDLVRIHERIGDARSRAIAAGKLADIRADRGELDDALRLLRDEVLPALQRLGESRSAAITQSRIADVLLMRGQLDAARRLLETQVLPVLASLQEAREHALATSKLAVILFAQGRLEDAIRTMRAGAVGPLERIGDVANLATVRAQLAWMLVGRNRPDQDGEEVLGLLAVALSDSRRLRLPGVAQIEETLRQLRAPADWIARLGSDTDVRPAAGNPSPGA